MDNVLGWILLQNQSVTRGTLDRSLAQQQPRKGQRGWKRLGDLLVESGDLNSVNSRVALGRQAMINATLLFPARKHPAVRSKFERGGDILVGTRPLTLDKAHVSSQDDEQRPSIKPGMTGLWRMIQHKLRLDFEQVKTLDLMYARSWTRRLDLKVMLKTILLMVSNLRPRPVRLNRPEEPRSKQPEVSILNINIDNVSKVELLQKLNQGVVFTPNVDHLMKLQRDFEFYNVYRQADYRVCDSQVLIYASRFLGQPIQEKISGSDFFPDFCEYHKDNDDITVFLLGGEKGVAEKAQARMNERLGRQIIVESHSPSFQFSDDPQECQDIVDRINRCQPTVLAVGVGAPKQEKWIHQYKDQLPSVKIFFAIGATIDFEAGYKGRSPYWLSKAGFEWLYRLMIEPRRLWKRYLFDTPFFVLLLKQKLGLYSSPWRQQNISHPSSLQTVERYSSK